MYTVVETPAFSRRADALLSPSERDEMIAYLAAYPFAGEEMVGTGGVRKLRFAAKGKGKSGGVRVIYYVVDERLPLFALLIYGKAEQGDLTAAQRKTVAAFAAAIKTTRRKRMER